MVHTIDSIVGKVFGKVVSSVVHYRKAIIGCPKSLRTLSYIKLALSSTFDIIPVDFYIVITVRSVLLMIKSDGVNKFVDYC